MSWSCTREAGETLARLSTWCRAATDSSNTYELDGMRYFFELDEHEHADGAATGKVFRMEGAMSAVRVSEFRIEPNGVMHTGPVAMRTASFGFPLGARIEISPSLDLWMRGARYGEVVGMRGSLLNVKLDRHRKSVALTPDLLTRI